MVRFRLNTYTAFIFIFLNSCSTPPTQPPSPLMPTITTNPISSIGTTTAVGGGNVTSIGTSTITARGLVWSTSANPTIALNTKTNEGNGLGSFSSTISGLIPNTTYYVRAYATNSVGTGYGNELNFRSSSNSGTILTLNCLAATHTGAFTKGFSSIARSVIPYTGGNGGSFNLQTVASTGVIGLTAAIDAGNFNNGNGELTYTITGVPESEGIANFLINIGGRNCTLTRVVTNSVTDASGNTYPTVIIGAQTWMSENLRTTKYNDGTNIPVVASQSEWYYNYRDGLQKPMMCWYNNNQTASTINRFGGLYNQYALEPAANGNKNVCPAGWHIPTNQEWQTLFNTLGGENLAGGKLKDTVYWNSPNVGATNVSNFSGRAGGSRSSTGSFYNSGSGGYWWSGNESTSRKVFLLWYNLSSTNTTVYDYDAASVRCIKN